MSIAGTEKPDKFACTLPEVPHATKPRDIPRRHRLIIQIIAFVLPLQLVRVILALKNDARASFWQAQTRRRVTPLEEMRMHRLIKNYIMRERGPKLALARLRDARDKEPVPLWLAIISITPILSFLAGGFTYKVLRAIHGLESGDAFFAIVMALGCIPMLIAGGIIVTVCRQQVLHNVFWIATATLGLGTIALSFGYFMGYID